MADNAIANPSTGAAVPYTFRMDELGGGELVPYTKIDKGGDGVSSPVTDQNPFPVRQSVETATGTITTQNLVPNGAATANSAVELTLNGAAAMSIQVTGTYTGALSVQFTLNGTRWETVTGAIVTNILSGVGAATIASATVGVFVVPVHGAQRARVTGLAAVTGTATVTLNGVASPTTLYAFQPTAANFQATVAGTVTANIGTGALAAGANLIGDVGIQVRANATGAASPLNYASPATPAGGTIKGGAGRLFGWHLVNVSAGVRWIKLFNQTAVTMGTTSAAYEFPMAAGATASIVIPAGISHTTGIMTAVTAARGLTDNTTTGLALGDVAGTFFFA